MTYQPDEKNPNKMSARRSRSCNRLYIISCLFFQLCFLTTRISSCGMSTHIDIAHQAINWFKDARNETDYRDIIMRHQDAFVGGNPYPDAMYSSFCFGGKFHSISEDTHWAPFLNATVRYIRKKYPKPWDQVCEKLIVLAELFDRAATWSSSLHWAAEHQPFRVSKFYLLGVLCKNENHLIQYYRRKWLKHRRMICSTKCYCI